MGQYSPDARDAFKAANAHYATNADLIDNVLQPLKGRNRTPEQVGSDLLVKSRRGGTVLTELKQGGVLDPDDMDKLGAAWLRGSSRARAGKQDASGEKFSANTFLTNWGKLSDEGIRLR